MLEEVLYYITTLISITTETKLEGKKSETQLLSFLGDLKEFLPGEGFHLYNEEWVTDAVSNASKLFELKEIVDKQIEQVNRKIWFD